MLRNSSNHSLGRKLFCVVVLPLSLQLHSHPAFAEASMVTVDAGRLLEASDLRYTRQAERSEAGLPIGNGTHGTLLWTEPDRLKMQINRVDVFSRDGSSSDGEESDWAGACGFVDVILGDGAFPAEATIQHLSVHDALATIHGPEITLRVFADHSRDVILLELDDRRMTPSPVAVELRSVRPLKFVNTDLAVTSSLVAQTNLAGLDQHFSAREHLCRSTVVAGWNRAGSTTVNDEKNTARISLPAASGKSVLFIASAAALNDSTHPALVARALLEEAQETGFEGVLLSHRESWHKFWRRSFIHAEGGNGDAELLAEHWAWTLYIMGSSSRGKLPVKFNGMIWSTNGDERSWGSLYWWWNTQILYRPLITTNHAELMQPLFNMYGGMLDSASIAARQQWGSRGIYVGETTGFNGPRKLPEPIADELREFLLGSRTFDQTSEAFRTFAAARNGYESRFNWMHKRSTAPYSWVTHILFSGAQVAWQHWLYWEHTLDRDFLRKKAYPLIRGVAEFYRNFPNLKLGSDDRYHLRNINDQELLWGARDAHNEIWAMRGIFNTAIAASEILNTDEDLREEWRQLAGRLAPAPLSTDRDVVEGSFFPHASGRPVWALARNPVHHVEGFESDNLVRPCVDYDLWTLESTNTNMTRIAQDTFDTEPSRLSALDGKHAYALSETPLAAAALGRTEDVRVILPLQLKRELLPNRLSLEDGKQTQSIEPIATVATATQLALLQSVPSTPGGDPVIRVFPAWPRDWDATFDLLARRGFRVRAAIRDTEILFVEIVSQLGGVCRVRNPFGKGSVELHSNVRGKALQSDVVLTFETQPDERIVMIPQGTLISERRVVVP